MSYDAHDFVDTICDALGVESAYSESDSADRCLVVIERLMRLEKQIGKLLPDVSPDREPVRQYDVQIKATNRTLLSSGAWHARNRGHAVVLALAKMGRRCDVATITVTRPSTRGKGAESVRAIAERAAT